MPRKIIQGINDLASQYPQIAAEWDYKKNNNILPSDVAAHSDKKYWWKCNTCGCEWQASPNSRTRSQVDAVMGCPKCGRKRTNEARHKTALKNSLQSVYPEIAQEWDFTKNKDTPADVSAHCSRDVWWICPNGHSYRAKVNNRTKNLHQGCPYCAGRLPVQGVTDLASVNPSLAAQWNYDKNENLTPHDVTAFSSKKVWWKCPKGHEWQASISNRAKGRNCPYCANKKLLQGYNDLQTTHPEIATDWDNEKNDGLTPSDVINGSDKKIWWKCHICGYEWQATANSRIKGGHGCPKCAQKSIGIKSRQRNLVVGKTDLCSVDPDLITEWDFEKNGDLKPEEFTAGSSVAVWWKCKKYGHSWKAAISARVKGSGCPYCHSHTSYPEQAIYYYLAQKFPDAINTDTHIGIELDIYIPSKQIAIEYDGVAYHQGRNIKEEQKNKKCKETGIRLIRVREYGLRDYSDCETVWIHGDPSDDELDEAIHEVCNLLNVSVDINVKRDDVQILKLFHEYDVNNSLVVKYPSIAAEWDYEKNGNLTPDMFSWGSGHKVWWKCQKGHSWYSSINDRTNQNLACPYCSGKRAIPGKTDLATRFPDLIKEWDFDKNTDIDPHNVLPQSVKKVWWKCSKGHEWFTSIQSRTHMHSGCPYCSGRKAISGENDIATTNPEILNGWAYNKNIISPTELKAGSEQKVWWHCRNCGHDYKASPYSRIVRHTGCPFCANQNHEYTRQQREGQEILSKAGQKMKILHYRKANDIDIVFEDGTVVEHKNYGNFLKGLIRNPNAS